MILSPGFRPATAAGDLPAEPPEHGLALVSAWAFDGTHGVMELTTLVLGLAWPIANASTKNKKRARTKCMNDPAASTIIRCQPGFDRNERGSSAMSTSSIDVIPTILTNPPTRSALTPYSVSPRTVDHSVRPNPTKNWVTRIRNLFAVRK